MTLLAPAERQVQRVFDFEHARFRDSSRVHFGPDLAPQLCADLGLAPEWFPGKRVLDAGCGSGRWSYALASLGARVVAVDLTPSGVRATRAALAPFPGCVVHQGSLFHLPYKPASFDLVLSWGVLHHTPNTRVAFAAIAPYVRRGGLLYVMLYERTAWRHRALTELVRAILRRLPDDARYRACRALVIRDPRWYRRISPWLKVCDGSLALTPLERSTLAFDNFDAYSPTYNHVHTQTEVRQWFYEEGFSHVVLTHPVRFTTPDAVARWGECGGAVHVRGTRSPSLLLCASDTECYTESPAPAVQQLRGAGYVTDDEPSAHTWLAHRRRGPAPQIKGLPVATPPPVRTVPRAAEFTRTVADRWRGLLARVPEHWHVERQGRWLAIAPPGAQPPFQFGIAVRPSSPHTTLESEADAAVARWFGGDQRATLRDTGRRSVDGAAALDRRYDLALGEARAAASFVYFRHHHLFVQLSATSAWDAPPQSVAAMHQAFESFVATISRTAPRRDPAALAAQLRGVPAAARGRLMRALRRARPVSGPARGATESAVTLESCYDAVLRLSLSDSASDLLDRARAIAATYREHRRARPGPAQGRLVR